MHPRLEPPYQRKKTDSTSHLQHSDPALPAVLDTSCRFYYCDRDLALFLPEDRQFRDLGTSNLTNRYQALFYPYSVEPVAIALDSSEPMEPLWETCRSFSCRNLFDLCCQESLRLSFLRHYRSTTFEG